jgi:hypothetical protein
LTNALVKKRKEKKRKEKKRKGKKITRVLVKIDEVHVEKVAFLVSYLALSHLRPL